MSDPDKREGRLTSDAAARRADPVEAIPTEEWSAYETELTGAGARQAADPSRQDEIDSPGIVPED